MKIIWPKFFQGILITSLPLLLLVINAYQPQKITETRAVDLKPNGAPCTEWQECQSSVCHYGYCSSCSGFNESTCHSHAYGCHWDGDSCEAGSVPAAPTGIKTECYANQDQVKVINTGSGSVTGSFVWFFTYCDDSDKDCRCAGPTKSKTITLRPGESHEEGPEISRSSVNCAYQADVSFPGCRNGNSGCIDCSLPTSTPTATTTPTRGVTSTPTPTSTPIPTPTSTNTPTPTSTPTPTNTPPPAGGPTPTESEREEPNCLELTAEKLGTYAPLVVRFRGRGEDPDGDLKEYYLSFGDGQETTGHENDLAWVSNNIWKIEKPGSDQDYLDHPYNAGNWTASLKFKDNNDQWSEACTTSFSVSRPPEVLGESFPPAAPQTGLADGIGLAVGVAAFLGLGLRLLTFLI